MATMQEYLEEMARRQATGWTPGVPNRFAVPVSTTWNLPSTDRTTMRQVVPKANLGDISAQSNVKSTTKRRGRHKSDAQSISDRRNTGLIKSIAPMLGAISKVAGPAAIAYDALRSDPALADQSAESLAVSQAWQDANPNWTVPSQDELVPVQEVYPPGTPGATLPSFDIAPDAGGAVGGYPTMDADYGTMATEESDYVPADPTGGLIDIDALAGRFDVGPTSMAQVGGIPSGRPVGTTTSPAYIGRPTGGSAPYAGPSRTEVATDYSLSQGVQTDADINDVYRHAGMVYGPTSSAGALGPYGDPVTGLENWRPSDLMRYTPFDTVRDAMLGYHDSYEKVAANQGNLGPTQVEQQLRDLVNNAVFQDLRDSGTPLATAVKSPNVVWDTSAGPVSRQDGAMQSMIGNNMGAMARLAMDDYYAPQNVSINNLAGTGPSLFDSISEIANQVDTFSSPLASSDITAQATIDDFTARQIAQDMALPDEQQRMLASNVPSVPVPAAPVSAPMAPRQQAMPEVSIPDALARQDVRTAMAAMAPRQDAMPAAPAGPSPAQIAAQVAAAEQSHRDQQASARQALQDFYNSRAYQQEGASTPAGLIDVATEVDTFANIAEPGGGYQGGYADMGGFEGYR